MDSFAELLKALGGGPLAVISALAIGAVVYLYKAREGDRLRVETDRKAEADRIQKLNDDHKATIAQVIPVSDKLADSVIAMEKGTAALDRIMDRAEKLMARLQEKP